MTLSAYPTTPTGTLATVLPATDSYTNIGTSTYPGYSGSTQTSLRIQFDTTSITFLWGTEVPVAQVVAQLQAIADSAAGEAANLRSSLGVSLVKVAA